MLLIVKSSMRHVLSYLNSSLALCAIVLTVALVPVVGRAEVVLSSHDADNGSAPVPLSLFKDDTRARSPIQAQVQHNRLVSARQVHPSSQIAIGPHAGEFWIPITIVNKTRQERWTLTFHTVDKNSPNPIKALSLYNIADSDMKARSVWPAIKNVRTNPSVTLNIASGETATHYLLVENWDGIHVAVSATLETPVHIEQSIQKHARHINVLWLVMGAVFGASLVQLILTRQSVQGFLAANALIVGGGAFLMQRYDVMPMLVDTHPMVLNIVIYCLFGIGACLIQWSASQRLGIHSLMSCIIALVNVIVMVFALVSVDSFFHQILSAEKIPTYILTLTGLALLVTTFAFTLRNAQMAWFLPAWFVLTLLPWASSYEPNLAAGIYLLMLAIAGVASVFFYWKQMDTETASLQTRLRAELKNIKAKYQEENDNWKQQPNGAWAKQDI